MRQLHSAMYEGWVRHRRTVEADHAFQYRMFMMYLDLDELEDVCKLSSLWSLNSWNVAAVRRSDYLGEAAVPLKQAVWQRVKELSGFVCDGPVRMLTHVRYFGLVFNPVTLYYCFDSSGEKVKRVLGQITNTPWGERHEYVVRSDRMEEFDKAFHVSPFLPMKQTYRWRCPEPGRSLVVHMENWKQESPEDSATASKVFDATLVLQRRELSGALLSGVLWRYPAMTLQVVLRIYWQALRLRLKGVTFYPHPSKVSNQVKSNPYPANETQPLPPTGQGP